MGHDDARHGAKQPERFDATRAHVLDDKERFAYVDPVLIADLLAPALGARADGARATLVDFGTGTGTYALELAKRFPAVAVLALDEQPEMLAKLGAKPEFATLPNLRAIEPPALAELAGCVDAVLALNVLHELGDDALRSLVALLRPDGLALVIDWSADVERPVGPPNDHVYGAAAARERLQAFGLRAAPVGGFPYHHAFLARR
jgi:SAM-dependent methyltransferase